MCKLCQEAEARLLKNSRLCVPKTYLVEEWLVASRQRQHSQSTRRDDLILNIIFSPSAAGSLKKALYHARRPDGVVSNFDDLALGPINPPDPHTRLHWMEEELRYSGWEWVFAKEEEFWKA